MRPWIVASLVGTALFLFGVIFQPHIPTTIIVRNESGSAVRSMQVNVTRSDTGGRLQTEPLAPFDQIYHLGPLVDGEERTQTYSGAAEYGIDAFAVMEDGRTARFYEGYIDTFAPWTHIITVTESGLLLNGKAAADVQRDPEKYLYVSSPPR